MRVGGRGVGEPGRGEGTGQSASPELKAVSNTLTHLQRQLQRRVRAAKRDPRGVAWDVAYRLAPAGVKARMRRADRQRAVQQIQARVQQIQSRRIQETQIQTNTSARQTPDPTRTPPSQR